MPKQQQTSTLYRRLLTYVLPFWPILLLGIVANVLYSSIDASFTYMLKPFMNKSFIDKDLTFVRYIPVIILCGIILRGIVNAVGGYCMTWVARSVVKVFRQRVFAHMLHLPASYYDNATSGQLLSKILYDVEQISQVSADVLTTFVQSLCLVIGLLVVMFFISWQLSLLFLITIPFVAGIVYYTNRRTRKASHSVQKQMGQVTEIAGEAIEGYQVVRVFGGHQYEKNKFDNATESSRRFDMKVAKIKVLNVLGVQTVIAIGIASIIFAAIHLSTVVTITAGGFLSILAAMLQLIKPMKNLSTVNSTIQRGMAGAESVFAVLDTLAEKDEGTKVIQTTKGAIRFEQVSFSYQENCSVLSNINLDIKAGQTVALVGRSGGGKTSLASLISRFYEVTEGKILLDGIDIRTLSLANLRSHVSIVSQHITLFNDTLFNNIAYGQTQVTEHAVIAAAKAAYAMEFIQQLPDGLNTLVGENGLMLSGGQRQRIAIARAMLKNAPILILDEATSALDTESERYIQRALDEIMQNRTTLVIAHRLSTIEQADLIVVLDKGEIVEQGSHQALLNSNGHYAQLSRSQQSDTGHCLETLSLGNA